jgi:hypothetical protein
MGLGGVGGSEGTLLSTDGLSDIQLKGPICDLQTLHKIYNLGHSTLELLCSHL